MASCRPTGVVCTQCLWWDWFIGCAEDVRVGNPRQPRACARFLPQEDTAWRSWLAANEAEFEGQRVVPLHRCRRRLS